MNKTSIWAVITSIVALGITLWVLKEEAPGNVDSVPSEYMEHYLAAEEKYGVDWYILAAVHFTETNFGNSPSMVSNGGAIGHMQAMPGLWVGSIYDVGGGLVEKDIDITSLEVISDGGGYGVDADGDGKADPWNIADSIHTAANYLSANGYSTDPRKSLYIYNNASWYVEEVMTAANKFKSQTVYNSSKGKTPPDPEQSSNLQAGVAIAPKN